MSESVVHVTLRVNDTEYPASIDMSRTLLSVIRGEVGLTGTKQGCDDCECGACMVLVEGAPVNSCSYLAAQCDGRSVTTIEGLAQGERLDRLQAAMLAAGGVQCGFCTPGMIIWATALLAENPTPSREEIMIGISGNLCRCTGYGRIIDAIASAVET